MLPRKVFLTLVLVNYFGLGTGKTLKEFTIQNNTSTTTETKRQSLPDWDVHFTNTPLLGSEGLTQGPDADDLKALRKAMVGFQKLNKENEPESMFTVEPLHQLTPHLAYPSRKFVRPTPQKEEEDNDDDDTNEDESEDEDNDNKTIQKRVRERRQMSKSGADHSKRWWLSGGYVKERTKGENVTGAEKADMTPDSQSPRLSKGASGDSKGKEGASNKGDSKGKEGKQKVDPLFPNPQPEVEKLRKAYPNTGQHSNDVTNAKSNSLHEGIVTLVTKKPEKIQTEMISPQKYANTFIEKKPEKIQNEMTSPKKYANTFEKENSDTKFKVHETVEVGDGKQISKHIHLVIPQTNVDSLLEEERQTKLNEQMSRKMQRSTKPYGLPWYNGDQVNDNKTEDVIGDTRKHEGGNSSPSGNKNTPQNEVFQDNRLNNMNIMNEETSPQTNKKPTNGVVGANSNDGGNTERTGGAATEMNSQMSPATRPLQIDEQANSQPPNEQLNGEANENIDTEGIPEETNHVKSGKGKTSDSAKENTESATENKNSSSSGQNKVSRQDTKNDLDSAEKDIQIQASSNEKYKSEDSGNYDDQKSSNKQDDKNITPNEVQNNYKQMKAKESNKQSNGKASQGEDDTPMSSQGQRNKGKFISSERDADNKDNGKEGRQGNAMASKNDNDNTDTQLMVDGYAIQANSQVENTKPSPHGENTQQESKQSLKKLPGGKEKETNKEYVEKESTHSKNNEQVEDDKGVSGNSPGSNQGKIKLTDGNKEEKGKGGKETTGNRNPTSGYSWGKQGKDDDKASDTSGDNGDNEKGMSESGKNYGDNGKGASDSNGSYGNKGKATSYANENDGDNGKDTSSTNGNYGNNGKATSGDSNPPSGYSWGKQDKNDDKSSDTSGNNGGLSKGTSDSGGKGTSYSNGKYAQGTLYANGFYGSNGKNTADVKINNEKEEKGATNTNKIDSKETSKNKNEQSVQDGTESSFVSGNANNMDNEEGRKNKNNPAVEGKTDSNIRPYANSNTDQDDGGRKNKEETSMTDDDDGKSTYFVSTDTNKADSEEGKNKTDPTEEGKASSKVRPFTGSNTDQDGREDTRKNKQDTSTKENDDGKDASFVSGNANKVDREERKNKNDQPEEGKTGSKVRPFTGSNTDQDGREDTRKNKQDTSTKENDDGKDASFVSGNANKVDREEGKNKNDQPEEGKTGTKVRPFTGSNTDQDGREDTRKNKQDTSTKENDDGKDASFVSGNTNKVDREEGKKPKNDQPEEGKTGTKIRPFTNGNTNEDTGNNKGESSMKVNDYESITTVSQSNGNANKIASQGTNKNRNDGSADDTNGEKEINNKQVNSTYQGKDDGKNENSYENKTNASINSNSSPNEWKQEATKLVKEKNKAENDGKPVNQQEKMKSPEGNKKNENGTMSDEELEKSSKVVLKQLKELQSLAQSPNPDPKKIDVNALHPGTVKILKKLGEVHEKRKNGSDKDVRGEKRGRSSSRRSRSGVFKKLVTSCIKRDSDTCI